LNYREAAAMLGSPDVEGRVAHMYLDSKGKVTVGVGQLLPSASIAAEYPFFLGAGKPSQASMSGSTAGGAVPAMSNGGTGITVGRRATRQEIEAEFRKVKALTPNLPARWYGKHTTLVLKEEEITALLFKRIRTFETSLRGVFHEWDKFPASAQLALLDLQYNTGSVASKFPSLTRAAKAHDWARCAIECHRAPPVGAKRNLNTRLLFLQAAQIDKLSLRSASGAGVHR